MMASPSVHEYNMRHERRGLALIINNEEFDDKPRRVGTQLDGQNITDRLKELEFDVESHNNLKKREMKAKMKEAAARENYHKMSDCFVCVILSHGDDNSVYGTDGPVELRELLDQFKGDKCKSLAGKPKLFFIQSCREDGMQDEGMDVPDAVSVKGDSGDGGVETYKIPTEADFLIAYSSLAGLYAWRNTFSGSWFIQALCAVLKEHGTTLDLMTIMTRVNNKVAFEFESLNKTKQIPCITSLLTKDVYFRPKK